MGDREENIQAEETQEQPQQDTVEDTAADEGLKDSHGHDAISRGKYERDMKAKDAEISALRAEVEKASETKEGREELNAKITELEKQLADQQVNHALEMAHCKNTKAAKALLADYDGNVQSLKEACPYLFETEERKGSTGLKPKGAADKLSALDKAMGLVK